MTITLSQIIVWLIIGLIGGTLVGMLVRGQREGFGWWSNLGIGLVGALVGGIIFRLFNILPGLDDISVSLRDILSAVIGAMLFLFGLWLWNRYKGVP